MDAHIAWENLAQAIADVHRPGGDPRLKLDTVAAGVQLLFEHTAADILKQVERSSLPTRAIVSWLVFEGDRLPGVNPHIVHDLRRHYEARCPPGQGIIPPPPSGFRGRSC